MILDGDDDDPYVPEVQVERQSSKNIGLVSFCPVSAVMMLQFNVQTYFIVSITVLLT